MNNNTIRPRLVTPGRPDVHLQVDTLEPILHDGLTYRPTGTGHSVQGAPMAWTFTPPTVRELLSEILG